MHELLFVIRVSTYQIQHARFRIFFMSCGLGLFGPLFGLKLNLKIKFPPMMMKVAPEENNSSFRGNDPSIY